MYFSIPLFFYFRAIYIKIYTSLFIFCCNFAFCFNYGLRYVVVTCGISIGCIDGIL